MSLIAATKRLAAGWPALACGAAAALGALALVNHAAARRTEREHPPRGKFIEVDGVRLHYTDRGVGKGERAALGSRRRHIGGGDEEGVAGAQPRPGDRRRIGPGT